MKPQWHLSYARGYMELRLFAEAEAELENVPQSERRDTEFLAVRACLLQEQQKWAELEVTAGELRERNPQDAGWWIMHAYATRRAQSMEQAEAILLQAVEIHPADPTILFNLGCYACQRGERDEARALVQRAIALDRRFAETAKKDPDLEAIRDSLE